MKVDDRTIEISNKILEIGKSLIEEGNESDNFNIIQSGNIMIIISAAMLSIEDMFLFGQICSMFTAKQILDSTRGFESDEKKIIGEFIRRKGLEKSKRKPKNGGDKNV